MANCGDPARLPVPFIFKLPRLLSGDRDGDGERLRCHSSIRFDAVRASLGAGNGFVMAGQGMPSETLGSGIVLRAGFQSPKLDNCQLDRWIAGGRGIGVV